MTDSVCPKCFGSGALEMERTHMGIPVTRPCQCLIAKDIIRNLNRGWAGLSSAQKIEKSPLSDFLGDNVYVTAGDEVFKQHLRHVAIRMGPSWNFKVVSDSDLMTAWLSPASLLGKEILDPDSASVSSEKATLVDLVEPPDLLVLRLGVKAARNSAMSEVFLEALQHRSHIDKPVWVIDQPTRKLEPGHMCFSDEVVRALSQWHHLTLGAGVSVAPGLRVEQLPGGVPTGLGATPPGFALGTQEVSTATRRVEMPTPLPPKKKFSKRSE